MGHVRTPNPSAYTTRCQVLFLPRPLGQLWASNPLHARPCDVARKKRGRRQTGATSGAAHWAWSVKAAAGPAVRPREDDVGSPKAASIDALMFCHVHVPDHIVWRSTSQLVPCVNWPDNMHHVACRAHALTVT
jgi:hypothetical protein